MTDVPRVELAPGYSIAKIINGCWQLTPDHGGGPESRNDVLRRFAELVDRGFTTFDCADIYTGTEELLGDFRDSLSDADTIQVHTKLVPNKDSLAELNDKKIVFSDLVDEIRRSIAMDYVRHSEYGLTDVSMMLGYGELSSFSRAFKRWTGTSPQRIRQSTNLPK